MKLTWKNIPSAPGYMASSQGQIRKVKSTIINTYQDKDGYECASLLISGVHKMHKVHRLIAEAFLIRPFGKDYVNHLNGVKNDNRIANLQWCSSSENRIHAMRTLGVTSPATRPGPALSRELVFHVLSTPKYHGRVRDLAELFGKSTSVICQITSGNIAKKLFIEYQSLTKK